MQKHMSDGLDYLRSLAQTYPPDHPDHYREVLRPLEELGVECGVCGAPIDPVDLLEEVQEGIDPRVGGWVCEGCDDPEQERHP